MTSVLLSVVAAIALAADPSSKGLPLGLPPAADDAVISQVAPPQCLLYVNWAGTASPNAKSSSETEKLLAEPEVQDFLNAISKVVVSCLRKADETTKEREKTPTTASTPPATLMLTATAVPLALPQTVATSPVMGPGAAPSPVPVPADCAVCEQAACVPCPECVAAVTAEKAKFNISAEDYGDWLSGLLTHPTAIFVADVKVTPAKSAEAIIDRKKPRGKPSAEKKDGVAGVVAIPETDKAGPKPPQPTEGEVVKADGSPEVEIQAGMVVSLGPDAARLHAKFVKYVKQAKKAGADGGLEQIKIAGKTWYRSKPTTPGDKNRVTFGFHGKYFVVGVGKRAVEGMLARWNSPTPTWLAKALDDTQVPRRTGIVYLNLKALRDKLLPLAPSQKDAVAALELLGLYNVDSLVSTTGLEDYGMINRVLLALDGKPRGLLDMVADRPLTAKDLEPIPQDALLAVAARVDLDRTSKVLLSTYEKAGANSAEIQKGLDEFKKTYNIDLPRFLASIGDAWCLYNSPGEGEMAFLGWTAVAPVRDRAALVEGWEKLCAINDKAAEPNKKDTTDGKNDKAASDTAAEFRKCHFAGHEIYYLAGQAIAPAFYISDREMVMTLNMPAMKAYLARKDHRSLATQPGVALALKDENRPVALGYCNAPALFDSVYPWCSLCATSMAAVAHQAKIDLDPTFWPSAPAIRSHLRPDITTVQRTPHGLQLTCRYSLPTGGASGPLWLIGMGVVGSGMSELASPFTQTLPTTVFGGDTVKILPATVQTTSAALPAAPSCGADQCSCGTSCGTATVPGCIGYACPPTVAPQAPTTPSPLCERLAASQKGAVATAPAPNSGYASPSYNASPCFATPAYAGSCNAPPPPPAGYANPYGPYSAAPYSAAPRYPNYGYASPYGAAPASPSYGGYGSAPAWPSYSPNVAAQPSPNGTVTVPDVIAMTRAGVDEGLIINQIRGHGLAAPLQVSQIIELHQQGVSRDVIAAMQQQSVKPAGTKPASSSGGSATVPTPGSLTPRELR